MILRSFMHDGCLGWCLHNKFPDQLSNRPRSAVLITTHIIILFVLTLYSTTEVLLVVMSVLSVLLVVMSADTITFLTPLIMILCNLRIRHYSDIWPFVALGCALQCSLLCFSCWISQYSAIFHMKKPKLHHSVYCPCHLLAHHQQLRKKLNKSFSLLLSFFLSIM